MLSSVNYSEVLVKMCDRRVALTDAMRFLDRMKLVEVPFDHGQAFTAASLREETRTLGLSFGDRACLACAVSRRLPVLTADRRLAEAKVGVKIHLIR